MKNLIFVLLFAIGSIANAQAYFKGGNLIVSPTGKAGIGTTSPQVILDIQGTTTLTSSILLPRGTTANRHAGVNGMIRYNTNTSVFEGYSNGSWSTLGSGGGGSGTVTAIYTGTGIVPNTITGTGTIVIDAGTAANKIVQLTSAAQLPAVDGFLLTNINGSKVQTKRARVAGSNITLSSSGWTQLTFASTTYDNGGFVSGNTFVIPSGSDGTYLLCMDGRITASGNNDWLQWAYSINSASASVIGSQVVGNPSGTDLKLDGSCKVLNLVAADIVRIFMWTNLAAPATSNNAVTLVKF